MVGVVDAEVDADAAGPDLFEDGPEVIGQSRDEVVPAANGASDLAGDAPRVEAHGHDLVDVRLDQLRDAHLGLHAAAEPLESQQDAEQQRQISGDHQPVLVEELHAAGHDPVHVELSDTDEQVAVEPRLDGTPQRAHVDVRRWGRELHHDVDERVDVTGAGGDDQRLELSPTLGGQASHVAEVEDRQVLAVGEEEVPRMRIGVIEAVAEDHLQVDVGGPAHEHLDIPAGRLDAGPIRERMADHHRHRQHLLTRLLGKGLGDDDIGLAGEVEPEPLEVGELLAQVDGCFHHPCELGHEDRRPKPGDLGVLGLQERRQRLQQLEVRSHLGIGAVVQHLHGNDRSVAERRPVDLRD